MRDKDLIDLAHGLLLGLRNFVFRLPVDRADLNRWDKPTLVLAGLVGDTDSRLQFSAPPEGISNYAVARVASGSSNLSESFCSDTIHQNDRGAAHDACLERRDGAGFEFR